MKLLSPAGNFDCLKTAVFNGADEVYLGINNFNARNNIEGFTTESLKDAVDFCHIYNVKINLAINILISNQEMQEALDVVALAYNYGVDYFIVQDLGFASLIKKYFPLAKLHASTQMGIHNLEGVKFIENFGFSRVVLSRETPLEEIKRIRKNSKIEIEYFVHGALCVAFSGNCYLSSYLNDASGNRGKCKQLCRLPYSFEKDGKKITEGYLLSAKDFDMTNNIKDLIDAGVDVIKIEGRARRPFYVATATREYKKALNGLSVDKNELSLAFNRGFTPGYFNGNGNIISNTQNHTGVFVGTIYNVIKHKTFNELFVKTNVSLSKKSTFKTFDNNGEKTVFSCHDITEIEKGVYRLTTANKVDKNDKLHLIVDYLKESNLMQNTLKKDVEISLFLKENKPILCKTSIGNDLLEIEGDVCQVAKTSPISIKDIEQSFAKSDYFNVIIKIEKFENVFLPKKQINQFRRTVLEKIYNAIVLPHRKNTSKTKIQIPLNINQLENYSFLQEFNATVLSTIKEKNIIYSPEQYSLNDIMKINDFCQQIGKKVYLDLPIFALEKDITLLKDIIYKTGVSFIANNYYALTFKGDMVVGGGLNVYNNFTAKVFNKTYLMAEGPKEKSISMPYMTLRHCPVKTNLKCTCENCAYCDNLAYKMQSGKVLKIKRKKLSSCTFYLTD